MLTPEKGSPRAPHTYLYEPTLVPLVRNLLREHMSTLELEGIMEGFDECDDNMTRLNSRIEKKMDLRNDCMEPSLLWRFFMVGDFNKLLHYVGF